MTAAVVRYQAKPDRADGNEALIEHDVSDVDSLQGVPAFQAFVRDIAERCAVPPVAMGATAVGRHLGA